METLARHFDTALDTPDGIKKLRELILSLAMKGKLVAQDAKDQPASELLKEIEAEKARLVKEGRIKKQESLSVIKPEEVPYDIPETWIWIKFQDCYYTIGTKKNQVQTNDYLDKGEIPIVDQGKSFIVGYSNAKEKVLQIDNPVIIFGDHTKNIKYVDFDFIIGADGVKVLKPYSVIYSRFFYYAVKSYKLYDRGYARHFSILNENFFPLPPIAEQKRIVEKIDQLMSLCDKLEAERNERDNKRISVHTSAVNRLLGAHDKPAFDNSWSFITKNFNELYSVTPNVAELKKAILQLAVMGKLVPQDKNDQPAGGLLKEIEKEKARLVKEGRIKNKKNIPESINISVPYEIPQNWEWVQLGSIVKAIEYGTSEKSNDDRTKIPVFRMGNIFNGQLTSDNLKYVDSRIKDLPNLYLKKDDLLFNRTNSFELVGKTAIYRGKDNVATFASYLIRVQLFKDYIFPDYINTVMNTIYFRLTQIVPEITQQCGQANFNGTKLAATLIPLPPLAEQKRIVAKIDQLMELCNSLEQGIKVATEKRSRVLGAVLARV